MAENTPGNLAGMGAGFFLGRAAQSRKLEQTVERLERSVDQFSNALNRLSGNLGGAKPGAPTVGGATQQSQSTSGNGGNWSGLHAPVGHRADVVEPKWTGGGGTEPTHRAENGGGWSFGGGGGAHSSGAGGVASNLYQSAGGRAGIAKGAAVTAGGLINTYTGNRGADMVMDQSIASQYSIGGDWRMAYGGMFGHNYTAASHADLQTYAAAMGRRSGFTPGSTGYTAQRGMNEGLSVINPSISNTQAEAAASSLGSVTSFNMMRGLGIQTMSPRGNIDVVGIANQILGRIRGSENIRSRSQIDAAFGPAGSIRVTLENYVRGGFIPPESVTAVEEAIRGILKARAGGVSYDTFRSATQTVATSSPTSSQYASARDTLKSIGMGDSQIANYRAKEGMGRDTEAETISGFIAGVDASTDALKQFRSALNAIMGIPGVGEAVGGASGVWGTLGTVARHIPGPFGGLGSWAMGKVTPGGDGPSSLSSASAVFGGAARSGGGSSGGVSATAGRASSGNSSHYSLGSVKPWVSKAASVLGPMFGISTIGGYRASSDVANSDHPKGLALDFMCGKSTGDRLAPYAVANHRALNITYVIWQQRIWSINNPSWKKMEDRGSPTANHMDHVHVSFLASPTNGDLGGLPSGGTGASGGMGGSLGGAGSSSDNGGSAFTSSGGGSGYGQYTEMGALAFGSGGGFGGPADSSSSGSGSGGSGGGFGTTGAGGPGSVRLGTYNVYHNTTQKETIQDFRKIMGQVDVFGTSESRSKHNQFAPWLKDQGWGYMQGHKSDTGIAYNSDKYSVLKRGDQQIEGTLWGGKKMHNTAPYMLLQDKATGSKFWVISAHTQVHGYKGGPQGAVMRKQYAQIRGLYSKLQASGSPVFLLGDLNNPHALQSGIGPKGTKATGAGLDYLVYGQGATLTGHGSLSGTGFDHHGGGQVHSDHPFIWGNFNIGSASSGGGGGPLPHGGSSSANQKLGMAMAARMGWSGSQWNALRQLWMHESGWRTNADNPTSSAYGIPQALTQLHNLGGTSYMTDPRAQIRWGLNYIKGRYGSPSSAWNFWQKNHWYDSGEWDIRDDKDARVHKGEMILPTKVAEEVRNALSAPGIGGARMMGGGAQIVFEEGAITIKMSGPVSTQEARRTGHEIVEAVVEDQRMQRLARGLI